MWGNFTQLTQALKEQASSAVREAGLNEQLVSRTVSVRICSLSFRKRIGGCSRTFWAPLSTCWPAALATFLLFAVVGIPALAQSGVVKGPVVPSLDAGCELTSPQQLV